MPLVGSNFHRFPFPSVLTKLRNCCLLKWELSIDSLVVYVFTLPIHIVICKSQHETPVYNLGDNLCDLNVFKGGLLLRLFCGSSRILFFFS